MSVSDIFARKRKEGLEKEERRKKACLDGISQLGEIVSEPREDNALVERELFSGDTSTGLSQSVGSLLSSPLLLDSEGEGLPFGGTTPAFEGADFNPLPPQGVADDTLGVFNDQPVPAEASFSRTGAFCFHGPSDVFSSSRMGLMLNTAGPTGSFQGQIDVTHFRRDFFPPFEVNNTESLTQATRIASQLLAHEGEREKFSAQSLEEQAYSVLSQDLSGFIKNCYFSRRAIEKMAALTSSHGEAVAARDEAARECAEKQKVIDRLVKEREGLDGELKIARDKVDKLLAERAEMSERLSETAGAIQALNTDLAAEKERSFSEGACIWAKDQTVDILMGSFIDCCDSSALDWERVEAIYHERSVVITPEKYFEERRAQTEGAHVEKKGGASGSPKEPPVASS